MADRQRPDDQAGLEARGRDRLAHLLRGLERPAARAVGHELDARHEADAPHVAHQRQAGDALAERGLHVGAGPRGVADEILAEEDVQVGHRGRRAHRVPAVREAVGESADLGRPGPEHRPHPLGDDHAGEREVAAREPLGDRSAPTCTTSSPT